MVIERARARRAGQRGEAGERPSDAAGADPFRHPSTRALVAAAIAEDVGRGDITTAATVPAAAHGRTALVARERCVVAGLPIIETVLREVAGPGGEVPSCERLCGEGERVARRSALATIAGPLRTILTAERVLLNLVQHLCGVATATRAFVDAIAGTRAAIVDTRKTLPGLRLLEKYAVRAGGGRNHRFGLDDGVLIKDNHIAACGSLEGAVHRARAAAPHGLRIEVECEELAQVREALAAGADAILLDNMSPERVRRAVDAIAGRALIEVSGGVSLEKVRAYAETGVDLISVGSLTHSVRAVDIGLDFLAEDAGAERAVKGRARASR